MSQSTFLNTFNSNYNLIYSALQHDWHHYMYTENFGSIGILDAVHGTDVSFEAWLAELSHRDAAAKLQGDKGEGFGNVYTHARKEIARREAGGQRSPGHSS
jgi:sterol desaturase/sphingolipid hydroxylase (fatty acid hydroxylase superfamily)